jgi:hypothetical protein
VSGCFIRIFFHLSALFAPQSGIFFTQLMVVAPLSREVIGSRSDRLPVSNFYLFRKAGYLQPFDGSGSVTVDIDVQFVTVLR